MHTTTRRPVATRWASPADAFAIARIAFATGHGAFHSSADVALARYTEAEAAGSAFLLAELGGILAGVAVLTGDTVELWVPERFVESGIAQALLDAIDTWQAGGERLAS